MLMPKQMKVKAHGYAYKALWVACTTTTQSLYEAIMGENPSRNPGRVRQLGPLPGFRLWVLQQIV